MVAEILPDSTATHDRGIKFQDYESHGVLEYWIVDPEKQVLEQYVLENGLYELRMKSADGFVHSAAIEGFRIPVQAIFDETENARVLARFWQGL